MNKISRAMMIFATGLAAYAGGNTDSARAKLLSVWTVRRMRLYKLAG